MERQLEIDGHTYRAGTSEDAGRLCVTSRSPEGVDAATYRYYVTGLKPANRAPGPIQVRNPTGEGTVPARDGATGGLLYDLDAVERWNASRPGRSGYHRAGVDPKDVPFAPGRARLLQAAIEGRIRVLPGPKGRPRTMIDGEPADQRSAQAISELRGWGLLGEPTATRGRVSITKAGRAALKRWGVT